MGEGTGLIRVPYQETLANRSLKSLLTEKSCNFTSEEPNMNANTWFFIPVLHASNFERFLNMGSNPLICPPKKPPCHNFPLSLPYKY